jgi:protein gp37
MAKRLKAMGSAKYQTDGDPGTSGPGFGITFHNDALTEPLRWRKPRRIFVNSMSDLAHARISDAQIAKVFAVMALAPQHQFQLLTKRPKRLARLLSDDCRCGQGPFPGTHFRSAMAWAVSRANPGRITGVPHDAEQQLCHNVSWPLTNVWIGTSIESDDYCWRADELRRTPAAIRFLSCEPLLGPLPSLDLTDIDWVIVGGESGPRFRPMDLDWVRDLRDRCVRPGSPSGSSSTALFFKQVGGARPKAGGRLLDGRTWDEFPAAAKDYRSP